MRNLSPAEIDQICDDIYKFIAIKLDGVGVLGCLRVQTVLVISMLTRMACIIPFENRRKLIESMTDQALENARREAGAVGIIGRIM